MTKQQPTPTTPFMRFKSSYTPLYRALLVLSSLAVLISLAGLTNIRTALGYLQSDTLYALSGLITILIVPIFMISSLILLWHKHPFGIRLRLIGYLVSTIATIFGFFTSQETLNSIVQQALEASKQTQGSLTPEMAASIGEASFFGALYIALAANLLFALLWWKAWKKQVRVDAKRQ